MIPLFQMQEPSTIYAISMNWFRQWQLFARGMTTEEPGPVNNKTIVAPGCETQQPIRNVRQGSDYAQIDVYLWRFFYGIYGGGPEIVLRGNPVPIAVEKSHERQREDVEMEVEGMAGDGNEEDPEEEMVNEEQQIDDNVIEDEEKQLLLNPTADVTEEKDYSVQEIVGDHPVVLGKPRPVVIPSEAGGKGDASVVMETQSSNSSITNGVISDGEHSATEPRTGKIRTLVDPKERHRMMQSSGLFGAEGE